MSTHYLHRMVIKLGLSTPIMIILFAICGCHKLCSPANYRLAGGISIFSPVKDSIHIGDTLWFSCSFPANSKFKNLNDNDSINLNLSKASNVITDIHVSAIPKRDTITDALDSFIFINGKGAIYVNHLAPHTAETITFIEENNKYQSSWGIVAQKKGIYVITIIDMYQIEKSCIKASLTIPITDSIDKHLYFLNEIYFPGSRYEQGIPGYELTHDYCFKVS